MQLVDTRNIGKVPSYGGEREGWSEWSFQFTAFTGAANPKATKALKWAATAELAIDEDDQTQEDEEYPALSSQLYLALALLCKGPPLVMVRNVANNNGLEAWRVLNAHYDPGSKGRQRVRMRQLLQPQKPNDISGTRESIEKWERDVRDYETRFQKSFDEDVKIGVVIDMAPLSVQQHCHLNAGDIKTYPQIRRIILDFIEASCDRADAPVPMDVSALDRKGKGKGKGTGKTGKGKGGKGKGKSKGKSHEKGKKGDQEKKPEKFDGTCSHCGKYGHKARDCWSNENRAKNASALEHAGETSSTGPSASVAAMYHTLADEEAWPLFSVGYSETPEPDVQDFLIDSGAAVGVCPASMVPGSVRRGKGISLVSATGHGFTSEGETTVGMRTAGGLLLKGRFQVAPASTKLRRPIVSVSQVVDQGNEVIFNSQGGRIVNKRTGHEIPIFRSHGVFNLKAEVLGPTAMQHQIMSVTDQDHDETDESQAAKPLPQPRKPSPEEVAAHELTHLPYRSWCSHCVRGRGRADDHRPSDGIREVPLISTDYLFLGDEAESKLTILTVYDSASGMTFANPVPSKGVMHAYPERALAGNLTLLGYRELRLRSDQEPAILALKRKAVAHVTARVLLEESPIGDSQSNGAVERANANVQGLVRTLKDSTERLASRKLPLECAAMTWLVRHAGWLLSNFQRGTDGATAEQRLKRRAFHGKLAAFGELVLYLPHKKSGPAAKLETKWKDGIWLGINPRTGETIIGDGEVVTMCRSVRRRDEAEQWDGEKLLAVKGTPWNLKNDPGREQAIGEFPMGDIAMPVPQVPSAPTATEDPITRRCARG